jgi:hypothetical protein
MAKRSSDLSKYLVKLGTRDGPNVKAVLLARLVAKSLRQLTNTSG